MLDNLEMQARVYFFLSFVSESPEATAQQALEFTEKCWQEFLVETRESWLADIRALLQRREMPAAPVETSPRVQVQARASSKQYAGV